MKEDASPALSPAADHELPGHAELAALCKALGHPARVRILAHLAAMEGCVCGRIVDLMPLAQSTVSQHLKVLREAGLVRGQVEGPRVCYCVDRAGLARLKALVAGLGDDLLQTAREPDA